MGQKSALHRVAAACLREAAARGSLASKGSCASEHPEHLAARAAHRVEAVSAAQVGPVHVLLQRFHQWPEELALFSGLAAVRVRHLEGVRLREEALRRLANV